MDWDLRPCRPVSNPLVSPISIAESSPHLHCRKLQPVPGSARPEPLWLPPRMHPALSPLGFTRSGKALQLIH